MPPLTLLDLTNYMRELAASAAILADVHTLPLRERAGAAYGRALAHVPCSVLRALERMHAPLASWALVGLALAGRGRARSVPPAALALIVLFFGACAPELDTGTWSRNVGNRLVAGELPAPEPKHVRVQLAPESAELEPAELEPDPIFAKPAARCVGPWADNSDIATRYLGHPDTGLCAFVCSDAHVLLCAELGGVCAPASNGRTYCGGAR